MERQQLVEQLKELRDKELEIRALIHKLDYNEKFDKANRYIGKSFIEIHDIHDDYIKCIYAHSIDKNYNVRCFCVYYWKNVETEPYLGIHDYVLYNDTEDNLKDWREIPYEEFKTHYQEVLKRIDSLVNKLNNK